jgi:hypothetical protein
LPWWYFAHANHCTSAFNPARPLETHLRWYVPATTTRFIAPPPPPAPSPYTKTLLPPAGLISAALIAEADRLIREGKIHTGLAHSIITDHYDPLDDLPDW